MASYFFMAAGYDLPDANKLSVALRWLITQPFLVNSVAKVTPNGSIGVSLSAQVKQYTLALASSVQRYCNSCILSPNAPDYKYPIVTGAAKMCNLK